MKAETLAFGDIYSGTFAAGRRWSATKVEDLPERFDRVAVFLAGPAKLSEP
jgi:hypothetical protein